MEDELFDAFSAASSDQTLSDEEGLTDIEALRRENAELRDKLRRASAGIRKVPAAARPICCVGFYDNPESRACREEGRRQRVGVGVGREPADSLVRAIVEQVQYYMSADNLDKDQFLADLMTANAGAVPIARLAGFRKMQQLTANLPWVATALRRSPLLELCHGDQDVRPRRRYTMQEAQAMPLLPRDPAENGDDNALHEVVGAGASMVVCAGLSAVLDVGGGLGPRDDLPLYDLATDIPLPYAHHTGHKMRMDKRCFNCGATEHMVNECPQPRNVSRIQANRNGRATMRGNPGLRMDVRYHGDDYPDQLKAFAHFVPGVLSAELREAVGMSAGNLAPWIPRMRQYGYPPGYRDGLVRPGDNDGTDGGSGITWYDGDGLVVKHPSSPKESGPKPSREVVLYEGYNAPPPGSDRLIQQVHQHESHHLLVPLRGVKRQAAENDDATAKKAHLDNRSDAYDDGEGSQDMELSSGEEFEEGRLAQES